MTEDKRMAFIRNAKAIEDESVESITIEYEVVTDSHTSGEFIYGP
jgi:hypothetical protein